ncbi:MAG TPA: hypothetical protein DCY13_24435 [Verrucomicrobiales bacterium]|jgi:hypothetical protein|nr:hypothetical protein [Verrucomicrobiales bacterium]
MSVTQKLGSRRLSVTIALLLLAVYYAAVYRPLVRRELDQTRPFQEMQRQLSAAATNNPAISGLTMAPLEAMENGLRLALSNVSKARQFLSARLRPEPAIATNLLRPFQLIDYQNERLNRGDRLISMAGGRKVKLLPAVTAGLPEYTIENPRPELLWGQLSLVDGVLRAAVESGVASIESVTMDAPLTHPPGPGAREQFIEFPLRIELVGGFNALTRLLATVVADPDQRKELKLPEIDGLPVATLHRILAVKELPDSPGSLRLIAEFSGFVRLPSNPASGTAGPNP